MQNQRYIKLFTLHKIQQRAIQIWRNFLFFSVNVPKKTENQRKKIKHRKKQNHFWLEWREKRNESGMWIYLFVISILDAVLRKSSMNSSTVIPTRFGQIYMLWKIAKLFRFAKCIKTFTERKKKCRQYKTIVFWQIIYLDQ